MFRALREEAGAIPGDHSLAGLALVEERNLQDMAARRTYAGNSIDSLQDGEPPYMSRRLTFHEEVISDDDDDMEANDAENTQEPNGARQ